MIKVIEKNPITILCIVFFLMVFIHLNIPKITIMEARNFISAKEMLLHKNWLLPTLNGEARYEKPPLPTWLTALTAMIFGFKNLWALRFPAAFMILFSGIFTYFLSIKLNLNKGQCLRNGLILMTSFYIVAIINEAPWDLFAHGFMLAGIYFIFIFLEDSIKKWKYIFISSFFIGLSILSKGPVAVYAMLLPFLISYGFIHTFKKTTKIIFPLIIWTILFLAIGGWWYIYVRLADPTAFLKVATKETINWSNYNVHPFYYYWNFFIQSGIWAIPSLISLYYFYMTKRVSNKKQYQFIFWWTILSLILLSIIPEKKPRYLVPVLFPLALNIGFYIEFVINKFKTIQSKKESLPVYFNFGLIGIIALSLPIALLFVIKDSFFQFTFNYILTLCSSLLIGYYILKKLNEKKLENVFYLTVLFIAFTMLFGMPFAQKFTYNKNFRPVSLAHTFEKNEKIISYSAGNVAPELLWNYNESLKNIYKNNRLILPKQNKFGLILSADTDSSVLKELQKNYTLKLTDSFNLNIGLKNKNRLIANYYLVEKKDLKLNENTNIN